jgi:epoxide hydrolase 4
MRSPPIDIWRQRLPHGIELSCRACGEVGRPVLVFLHGFPEGAFVWDELMQHFALPHNGAWRCVAPNLRGFEHSSQPAEVTAYRAKHLVQDVVALLDILSPAQPIQALIAHDWGGAVAWNVANQFPQRMQQLVIMNSPHPGTFLRELKHNPAQQAASAYMNFLIRPDAAQRLAEQDHAKLLGFFKQAAWLTPDVRARYRALWACGLQGGLNYYAASPLRPDPPPPAVSGTTLSDLVLPEAALRIDLPTLVLWGMLDDALLPALLEGLGDWVADLQLHTLPDCSHWLVHEAPAQVAQHIAAFLAVNPSA